MKKNKVAYRSVGCPACFAGLKYLDEQDPETVILNHRVSADCIFSYPYFPEEKGVAMPKEIKKKFGKNKKNKKKKNKWQQK